MKKTKKIISLILTIQMLFACALIPSVIATDSVVEEPIDEVVEALAVDEGESPEELSPMMARGCYDDGDTYGTHAWSSIDAALAHYNMPASTVHKCNVTHNGIHYSYYVQMDSYRIYVRLA